MGVIVTSKPEHEAASAARSKVSLDELLRGVRPLTSVDELADPAIFASDEELDEFLVAVRADRDADLA
jgi:hypothetical protein